MKKIISILLTLVISCTATVIVCANNDTPPYDYSSFVGKWYSDEMEFNILNTEANNITFEWRNFTETYPIVDNKVTWDDSRKGWNSTYTLTFHDTSIHLENNMYVMDDFTDYYNNPEPKHYEYWLTSDNAQPRKITTGNYSVVLNGKKLEFDQSPIMCGDRILVPLRKIFEELGARVEWYDNIKTAAAIKGSRYICITIGHPNITIYPNAEKNSEAIEKAIDTPAILYNSRTLVPVRAVSEALDANVDWDGSMQTVIINTDNNNGSNNSNNTDNNKILEKEAEQIAINHYYSRTGCGAAGCYSEDANYYYVRVFMTYNPELHQYSFVVGECKVDKYTGEVQEI